MDATLEGEDVGGGQEDRFIDSSTNHQHEDDHGGCSEAKRHIF